MLFSFAIPALRVQTRELWVETETLVEAIVGDRERKRDEERSDEDREEEREERWEETWALCRHSAGRRGVTEGREGGRNVLDGEEDGEELEVEGSVCGGVGEGEPGMEGRNVCRDSVGVPGKYT